MRVTQSRSSNHRYAILTTASVVAVLGLLVRRASWPSTAATVSESGAFAAPATSASPLQTAAYTTRSWRSNVRTWYRLLLDSSHRHRARGHPQEHPCSRHTYRGRVRLPPPLLLPKYVTDAVNVLSDAAGLDLSLEVGAVHNWRVIDEHGLPLLAEHVLVGHPLGCPVSMPHRWSWSRRSTSR